MVDGLIVGLMGLVVGRILSVLVAAASDGTTVREAIRCRPGCGCRIGRWNLVPVLWWMRNKGRCLRCHGAAGVVPPSVEVVTAALFIASLQFVGLEWSLPAYLWFVSVTIVLGFVDLRHRRIPNRILLPGTIVGLALLAGGAVLEGRIGDLPEAVATGLGYFAVLLIPAVLTRGAIGMGDVKLAFLLGVFAGYQRWEVAVLAAAGAFVLAGAVAVLLMAFRVLGRNDYVPFGPFMAAAAWIAIARDLAIGTSLI